MRILSLFDGISCAQVACEKAGIVIDTYYASEIDKYAIQIARKNYPDTVHLGNVRDIKGIDFRPIDILIGGSPCQNLSIANRTRDGIQGEKSILFWEYVRILKEVRPKYFILENVNSMPQKDKQIITESVGVNAIMLDASLFSAQNRKRLFWIGKWNEDKSMYEQIRISQPEDKGILLKDILEDIGQEHYGKYLTTQKQKDKFDKINPSTDKAGTLTEAMSRNGASSEFLSTLKKMYILTGVVRKYTPVECERLMGLPDNYTQGVSNTQRYKCIGNAFHVDVIEYILIAIIGSNYSVEKELTLF